MIPSLEYRFIPPDEFLTKGRDDKKDAYLIYDEPEPQIPRKEKLLRTYYPAVSQALLDKGIYPLDTRESKEIKDHASYIPQTWHLGTIPWGEGEKDIYGYAVGIVRTDLSDGTIEGAFFIQGLRDEAMRRLSDEVVIGKGGKKETVVRILFTKEEADAIIFSDRINENITQFPMHEETIYQAAI